MRFVIGAVLALAACQAVQARPVDTARRPPAASGHVVIGNFLMTVPGGIAFIKDDKAAIVLDVGWPADGRPGPSAPDESINHVVFQQGDATIHFDWGRSGAEAAVARLTSDRPVTLTLTLPRETWHPFNAVYSSVPGGVDATAITGDGQFLPWRLRASPPPVRNDTNLLPGATLDVALAPGKPEYLTAGYGPLPAMDTVGPTLDAASARYEAGRARAEGAWGDFAGAIADNLNNSRTYSSLDRCVAQPVARDWSQDPDYAPYFGWDSFFTGLLASLEDKQQAEGTIRAVLRYQTPAGMIANVSHWAQTRSGFMSIGNSQPPVGALCVWKIQERWPDRAFLAEVYPKLVRWHEWWPRYSSGRHDGMLQWGSATGIFQEARYGCGWDDSPAYDNIPMVGTQMAADAVDLNALWSMDAEYLARMAHSLGRTADAERFTDEHNAMNARINQRLWNDKLGVWCTRLWGSGAAANSPDLQGDFVTRLTPMNFYPLICGAASPDQARRALALLYRDDKFWGAYPVPTLPYDDPQWPQQGYWKGHTWAPVNYLLWQGLRRYADPAHQADFARKSVRLFMQNWTSRGSCDEDYNSTDGSGGGDRHYTWGALMCEIGLESLYRVGPDGLPVPPAEGAVPDDIAVDNLPVGGHLYRMQARAGSVVITAGNSPHM